jgi:ring-1,2-phenylacetyl-CoA epoxidase subunit PaaE
MEQEVLALKVIEIVRETPDVISLKMVPPEGGAVSYRPGQFLTFIFDRRGKEVRRSFSLSSSPDTDKDFLSITVKRIPNGEISNHLYSHVRVGDMLQSLYPAGRFVAETNAASQRDIFLIAAGSGITPVYSLLKSFLIREPRSRITLIYSSRKESATIFYAELNALAGAHPEQFRCIYIFSQPEEKDIAPAHLNLELLRHLINENLHFSPDEAEFFLCGPFVFMRMAHMIIVAMGFEEIQIRRENFVILAEQEAIERPPLIADKSDKTVEITYRGKAFTITEPYDQSILKTALRQGIQLPYSCQAGICGICAAFCRAGEVKMSVNEVLTDKDLKAGLVLTCTGYAATAEVKLEIK